MYSNAYEEWKTLKSPSVRSGEGRERERGRGGGMSLYGDLPAAAASQRDDTEEKAKGGGSGDGKGNEKGTGRGAWGGGQAEEAARQAAKLRSTLPSPAAIAALRARHKKLELERDKALKAKRVKAAKAAQAAADVQPSMPTASTDVHGTAKIGGNRTETLVAEYTDEYDPMRPNSYEDCNARRIQARQRAEAERVRVEREREREEIARRRSVSGDVSDADRRRSLNVSGEEAFRRRAALSASTPGRNATQPMLHANEMKTEDMTARQTQQAFTSTSGEVGVPDAGGGGGGGGISSSGKKSAAERIMEKMGWKEGRGLGREEQGMTVPLVAKKIDARSGVIVPAKEKPKSRAPSSSSSSSSSRVIVMRNMVGRGEVDGELEEEVRSECSRYGQVLRVLIFEVTQASTVPQEEAVRIFVKFASEDVAGAALKVFNGRFFGGRTVRCAYFSEERFDANDVAPRDDETFGRHVS